MHSALTYLSNCGPSRQKSVTIGEQEREALPNIQDIGTEHEHEHRRMLFATVDTTVVPSAGVGLFFRHFL